MYELIGATVYVFQFIIATSFGFNASFFIFIIYISFYLSFYIPFVLSLFFLAIIFCSPRICSKAVFADLFCLLFEFVSRKLIVYSAFIQKKKKLNTLSDEYTQKLHCVLSYFFVAPQNCFYMKGTWSCFALSLSLSVSLSHSIPKSVSPFLFLSFFVILSTTEN